MNEQALQTPPRDVETITCEIVVIRDTTARMMAQSAAEIGKRLIEVKEQIPHGEWGKYLSERVEFSQSTANNFMKMYREYLNSQAPGDLDYSQAVALLSMPPEEREEFVQQNDVENMSSRELKQAIKERDEAREEARRAQEEVEAGRQAVEDAKALHEASLQAKSEAEERINAAEQRAAESAKAAEEAKAAAKQKQEKAISAAVKKATKEIDAVNADLREQLEEAKRILVNHEKEIADTKAEAQSAADKATVEARKAAEEEKSKLEQHIADLERKLRSAGNPAVQKFGVYFEQLQTTYNTLVSTVEAVEDPDLQTRFRSAVTELLKAFAQNLEGGA